METQDHVCTWKSKCRISLGIAANSNLIEQRTSPETNIPIFAIFPSLFQNAITTHGYYRLLLAARVIVLLQSERPSPSQRRKLSFRGLSRCLRSCGHAHAQLFSHCALPVLQSAYLLLVRPDVGLAQDPVPARQALDSQATPPDG